MQAIAQNKSYWYFGCQCEFARAKMRIASAVICQRARVAFLENDLKSDLIAILPRLRRFARAMTRSYPDADDLVQDACLQAIKRSEQWDNTRPLDRWVFKIMRNLWVSEIRKRKVRLGEGHVSAEEAPELVSTDTGEDSLVASQLMEQIGALPDELTAVLVLVSIEGFSYAEAAELLDIPVGTVMSRIHRARKVLAQNLAQHELSKVGGAQL